MNMQEILEKYRVLLDADTATISKSIHTIQKLDDKIGVQISHKQKATLIETKDKKIVIQKQCLNQIQQLYAIDLKA